ncbi:MAG: FG-GAP repeat protein, partial [Verrucomicrobiales bacterium]|nr:FG-GAP repeat protein [Verrucomicrobiales bacterium]
MKTSMCTNVHRLLVPLALAAGWVFTTNASAVDLTYQKLFGKWAQTPTNYYLGGGRSSLAVSPKWIVVGSDSASERGSTEGAVQVFNATTGAFVRKLLPPGTLGGSPRFGTSVAVWGDLVLVGSPAADSNKGAVHLFNLANGRLLKTLSASDGVAPDFFGADVALNGDIAVVSATGDDGSRGSIYLYQVATGAELGKLQASDGAAGAGFGGSLAMEGNTIAVGAAGADGGRGAVYFFDAVTRAEVFKLQPASWVAGDHFGATLSMQMGRVVVGGFDYGSASKAWRYDLATGSGGSLTIGSSFSSLEGLGVAVYGPLIAVGDEVAGGNAGKVHLFDSSDGTFIQTIPAPNGDTSTQGFGAAVALDGNMLVVSAPDDSTQATGAGCVHVIRPLIRPMEYDRVLGKGDFAPGAADIAYGTLGDVFVNASGAIAFSSTLTGAGSNRGRDFGVFTDITTTGSQELVFKSRQVVSGSVLYGKPSMISSNDSDLVVGLCTLSGSGVTSQNNQAFWSKTNVPGNVLGRTGSLFSITSLSGTTLSAVQEMAASNQAGQKQWATIFKLRSGVGGVSAVNDSALFASKLISSLEAVREGDSTPVALPAGSHLGQFAPRIAYHYSQMVFSTALTDTGITTANNAAVFRRAFGGTPVLVAQKGDTAVDATGA